MLKIVKYKTKMAALIILTITFIWVLLLMANFHKTQKGVKCQMPDVKFGRLFVEGGQMECGVSDCYYKTNDFCNKPVVEKHVIKPLVILTQILNPTRFIDIGSNIGIFSYYMSKLFDEVLSYEVQGPLNSLLSKTSVSHPSIKVLDCGLGIIPSEGWTPDGFKATNSKICDLQKVNFTNSLVKVDIDGNEETIINYIIHSKDFSALVIEVTPAGWMYPPASLADFCETHMCFLTEHDDIEFKGGSSQMTDLLNYIRSPSVGSSVIYDLHTRKLVYNLIVLN